MTDFIFLDSGTVVKERPGAVIVASEATGLRMFAEGLLAEEIAQLAQSGKVSARLKVLLPDEGQGLQNLLSGPRRELSGQSALKLGGYGTLFMEVTGQCNERCVHCYADASPEVNTSLPLDACQQALVDAKALGFVRVQFTGGDPLLYKELPQLVEQAASLGLRPEVYTNGLSLGPSLLGKLAPHCPGFAFSFYSANAEVHDQITRVPGSQERTLDAIVRVQKAGLALRVGVILMEENADDYEATESLLRGLGVEQVAWSGTSHVGRGGFFRPERAPQEGPGVHQDAPRPSAASKGASGAPSLPTGNLCLSSSGEVYPCIFNRATRLGSIHESSLQEIALNPSVRANLARSAQERLSCYSCRLTDRAIHQRVSPEGVA